MRVLLAGGGTGGHIFPAIAVAQELQERHPDVELRFAGSEQGREGDLVPRAGFALQSVMSKPLLSAGVMRPVTSLLASLPGALRLVRSYRPQVVLGTGGYASAVTVFAAAMLNVPTVVLDFNAIPGRTNRALAPLVDRIGVSFAKAMEYLPTGKCVLTGTPLRREFQAVSREGARAKLGLSGAAITLLIYGGSQGARRINEAALGAMHELLQNGEDLRIIHLCGSGDMAKARDALALLPGRCRERYKLMEFAHNMHELIAAADLSVSRAGGGIFELAACGVPMILVPLPNARDDHQLHNARIAERAGAARVILNSDLTAATLLENVQSLLRDGATRHAMAERSRAFAIPDAAKRVCEVIEELVSLRQRAAGASH